MTCRLFTFSSPTINLIWRVMLPTWPLSTETASTMLYYFWPCIICTADLLLVKLCHHPWLSWFLRSQEFELSQVTVGLIGGNKSTFLWEGKMRGTGPCDGGGILSDCSWWQSDVHADMQLYVAQDVWIQEVITAHLIVLYVLKEVRSSSGGLSFICPWCSLWPWANHGGFVYTTK